MSDKHTAGEPPVLQLPRPTVTLPHSSLVVTLVGAVQVHGFFFSVQAINYLTSAQD